MGEKENYRVKKLDYEAKFYCESMGYTFECVPSGPQGKFRIEQLKHGERIAIRKLVWNYKEQQYAIYQSYRDLAIALHKRAQDEKNI